MDDAIHTLAGELARLSYPEDHGGPLSTRLGDVAALLVAEHGDELAELLYTAEAYWTPPETQRMLGRCIECEQAFAGGGLLCPDCFDDQRLGAL